MQALVVFMVAIFFCQIGFGIALALGERDLGVSLHHVLIHRSHLWIRGFGGLGLRVAGCGEGEHKCEGC